MMTLTVAALLLAPLQYSFEAGTRLSYDSTVRFEGFIPILGGNEGTVVVEMGVAVDGLKPNKEDTIRAANEITRFKVTFNEAVLPLDVASVQTYFPRTTISMQKNGKIVESDAPDVKLPVRLPGLDVKRFPDVTYVPLQFPESDLKVGDAWEFKRKFGESDVSYKCTVDSQKGDAVIIKVTIRQEYELLEDAAMEVVKEERDAERRVKTLMTGEGIVLFETKRGIVEKAEMVNTAVSHVTKIEDGTTSQRKLYTTFSLSLTQPRPPRPTEGGNWFGNAWSAVSDTARSLWDATLGWWTVARIAFMKKVAPALRPGG